MACPGVRACKVTCGHRQMLDAYHQAREAQEVIADAATLGYGTETREFYRDTPKLTFRLWLQSGGATLTPTQ